MGALNMSSIEFTENFLTLAGIKPAPSRTGVVCFNHSTKECYINNATMAVNHSINIYSIDTWM